MVSSSCLRNSEASLVLQVTLMELMVPQAKKTSAWMAFKVIHVV